MFGSSTFPRSATVVAAAICAIAFMLGFATPSPGAAQPSHYRVHEGDTLWGIAAAHYPGTDPRAAVYTIRSANNLHGSTITAGQSLVLP
jgi:LysM repeat protein